MPNIVEFDNPTNSLKPDTAAYAADQVAGRRVDALYNQAGSHVGSAIGDAGKGAAQILQHEDDRDAQNEILKGVPSWEMQKLQLTQPYNTMLKTTDPADVPRVMGKILDDITDKSQNFVDSFQTERGRQWAGQQVAEFQKHMTVQAQAEMAVAAGHATSTGLHEMANASTNLVMQNPAMLDLQLGQADKSINAMLGTTPLSPADNAKIGGELRAKIKTTLVQAAIQGTMDKNPDAGLAMLQSGKYANYLDLAAIDRLQNYAKVKQNATLAQDKADEVEQRRFEKDTYNQGVNGLITGTIDANTGRVSIPPDFMNKFLDLQKLPGSTQEPSMGRTIIDWVEKQNDRMAKGEPAVTNKQVYDNFAGRMFKTPEDKGLTLPEVFKAHAEGVLSDKDFQFFVHGVDAAAKNPVIAADQARAHQFTDSLKHYFDNPMPFGPHDPKGLQRYGEFQRDYQDDYQRRRQGGEPARQIEDDWAKRVPLYQKGVTGAPVGDSLKMQTPLPPIVPKQPNESLNDYAARLMKMAPAPGKK